MIGFWIVVGRSCIDDTFRDKIKSIYASSGYPSDATTRSMYDLGRLLGLRLSLFEICEIVRVYAPFPKSRNRNADPAQPGNGDVDDRVDPKWKNKMKTAMNGQTLPPFIDNQVCEVVGVSSIDTTFMDGLVAAAKANDSALRQFLQ